MNRSEALRKKIIELKKYKEELLKVKKIEESKQKTQKKLINLVKDDNKKAGYVDALVLAFIVASCGITILLCSLFLINTVRF